MTGVPKSKYFQPLALGNFPINVSIKFISVRSDTSLMEIKLRELMFYISVLLLASIFKSNMSATTKACMFLITIKIPTLIRTWDNKHN